MHILLRVVLATFQIAVTATTSRASDPAIEALWKDPVFQRQFVGTYAANPDIEPRVMPEEVALLEKVRPFMGTDLRKAEELLQKGLKPESSAVLDFTLAGIQLQQDRTDDALGNYRRAVVKFPSYRRAWRNVGLIHVRKGEYDDGIAAFVKMIELGGGDAFVYGLLGHAYAAKQDFQPAEAAYRNALLLQPDSTEWRLGLTRCAFKQGKFEDCAALLDVLIARYPDKTDFWLLQAQTYLGMKRPMKAARNLEAIDLLGKSTVDSLHTLGDVYLSENAAELAAGAYERAIALDPGQPPARAMRAAEVLAAKGALSEARRLARRIHDEMEARLAEADRQKLLKLQARLSMAAGDTDEGTSAVLEEIVRLDPLDGEALLLLGQHYSRTDRPEKAMFWYERATGIESVEVNARIRHAQLLVSLGRYTDAIPLVRRAQELRPREDVARYLEQIERLSKSRR